MRPFLPAIAFGLVAGMPVHHVVAGGPFAPRHGTVAVTPQAEEIGPPDTMRAETGQAPENTRLMATGLAVMLGPFGAHRLYLGTTPKVAVIYGITFGGFGVLVLLDIGHLLFSGDLDPYRNNDRVFMWNARGRGATPP
jgi:TM2 domain-containing membrane protein YozV